MQKAHIRLIKVCRARGKDLWLLAFMLLMATGTWAQTQPLPHILQAEYFIDVDPGPGLATSIPMTSTSDSININFGASIAHLNPGYHKLVIRVKDTVFGWSTAEEFLFHVNPLVSPIIPPPPPFTLVAAEYFVDSDPGPGLGTSLPLIAGDSVDVIRNVSTTGLSFGPHTIGVRFKDLAGGWSTIKTYPILVFEDTLNLAGPQADFSWSTPSVGQPVQFTNLSTGMLPGKKFQWDIDADGVIDYTTRDIQHTFSQPGIYDVLMRVSNPGTIVDTSGLLGLYRFFNANITNYGGPLGTLIKQGGVQRTDGRHGDPNGAWSTEGTNQVAALTSATDENIAPQELTVSYWFKGSNSQYLFNLLDDNNNGVRSTLSSRHYVLGNSSAYFNPSSVEDNSWHHLAFTWTPDSIQGFKAYQDGQLIGSVNSSNYTLSQLDSLSIGANSVNEATGSFDDVFVFDRVLSDSEIYSLYNEAITDVIVKQVIVGPIPSNQIVSSGLDTICSGDSLILTGPTGSDHVWSTGDTTQQIIVKSSGQYICAYTDVHGNSRTSDTKQIIVNETPFIQEFVSTATNGSANGSISLAISGGTGQYTVSWTHGDTGTTLVQLHPGTYQALVEDGNCPQTVSIVVPNTSVTPTDEIIAAEAFFDVDPGVGNGQSIPVPELNQIDCHVDISLAGLSPGGHYLHTRVLQKDGTWSAVSRDYFFINDTTPEMPLPRLPKGDIVAAEYFFDTDPGPGYGYAVSISPQDTFVNVNLNLQTHNLDIGTHVLAVRVLDSYGNWSFIAIEDILIDVVPPPNLPAFRLPIVAAEYYFDNNDPGTGNASPLQVPVQDSLLDVNRSVDVSGLSVGTHELNIRVKDVRGQWSTIQQNSFDVDNSCTPPVASFSYGNAVSGSPVAFSSTSTGTSALVMYYWDIDADGTVEYSTANMQHTFSSPGLYSVKLSVVNMDSCYSETVQMIEVGPLPSAQIAASGPLMFCSGDTLTLTAPNGSNYIWNTLDTVAQIKVSSSGTFWATYIDAQGRSRQTDVVDVVVHPSMDVQYQIVSDINGLSNGGIRLFIQGGSTYNWDVQWNTGDTTHMISNQPAGNYTVTIDDGFCPQTLNLTIPATSVQPLNGIVAAEYILGDNDPGVGFGQNLAINPGVISNSITHIGTQGLAPGIHKMYVRLLDSDGSWSHLTQYRFFVINDTSALDTTVAPIVALEYFFDMDPGPGNGFVVPGVVPADSIDIALAASIASLNAGPHKFYARAKDDDGNWSFVKERNIYIDSFPRIVTPVWPIVAAEYFLGADPGPGNGTPISLPVADSIDLNRVLDISALAPGNYTYHLRIKDQSGLWNHLTEFDVVILPSNCTMPQASFAYTNAIAGQPVSLFNTSTNLLSNATVQWDMGADGTVDYTTDNVTHVFANTGIYDVLITVDNGGGCVQQHMEHIAVGPLPGTQISLNGSAEFCSCDSLVLTAPSGSSYQWNTGDSTSSITVHNSGLFNVIVTDANGNSLLTSSIQATARPEPLITTQVSPAYNGASDGTAAVNSVQGGSGYLYTYYWSTGDSSRALTGLSAGTYWVSVSDGYCTATDTLVVQNISMSPLNGIVQAEYFFGRTDPGTGAANPLSYGYGASVSSIESVPTTGLAPGTHELWFRVKQDDGLWGHLKRHFITVSDTAETVLWPDGRIADVEYFIDTDTGPSAGALIASGLSEESLDTSISVTMPALSPGLHEMAIRVKDEFGNWSIVQVHDINNCVPPARPLAGLDVDVCLGDTIFLSSSFSGAEPVYWLDPNGNTYSGLNQQIIASDTTFEGYYLVFSEGVGNCRSLYDTVFVDIVEPPVNPGDIRLSPTAICATSDTVNLFVDYQEDAATYQWLVPNGTFILAGNNTNGITLDLSSWNDSSAVIQVIVGNNCGSDTSNALALTRCGNVLPVVATSASYAISGDSAATGGIVVNSGASPVIRAGVCISTQALPDTNDRVIETIASATNFNMLVDGLSQGATYYVRAFAQNTQGVAYGNELSFTTPIQCQMSIDSVSTINLNQGVFQAHFGQLPQADDYKLEFRGVGEASWRTKSISGRNQGQQRMNVVPWFDRNIEVRLLWKINGIWIEGCISTFYVPCKNQILNIVVQKAALCEGDSVLLRAGYAGGYGAASFLWSNGTTNKRAYYQPGESASVVVTDLAGCTISQTFVAPTFDNAAIPENFGLRKLNATRFELSWSAPQLPAGSSLIGYRVAYRQRNTQTWTNTSLTTDTFNVVDFTGSGLPGGNYEFVAFTRYNSPSGRVNSNFTCREVKGYNGSGGKAVQYSDGLTDETLVTVYPNPASDKLYVQAPIGAEVQLTDMQGKILADQKMNEIEISFDLSHLAQGVYLIKVNSNDRVFTESVIKN